MHVPHQSFTSGPHISFYLPLLLHPTPLPQKMTKVMDSQDSRNDEADAARQASVTETTTACSASGRPAPQLGKAPLPLSTPHSPDARRQPDRENPVLFEASHGTPRCYFAFHTTFQKSVQEHPKSATYPSAKYSRDVQLPHRDSPTSTRTREGDEPASQPESSGKSVSGGGSISGAISPARKSSLLSRSKSKEPKPVWIPPNTSHASPAVDRVLVVMLSLGDSSMMEFVAGAPYTTVTELSDKDEFMIMACNGVTLFVARIIDALTAPSALGDAIQKQSAAMNNVAVQLCINHPHGPLPAYSFGVHGLSL
ncbi:hypothetical protein EV360DRAFT_84924 [Lentinula raphanica]|nr:hypothetical protein EV360DRAFT_84924 [Lentinula raphanica]